MKKIIFHNLFLILSILLSCSILCSCSTSGLNNNDLFTKYSSQEQSEIFENYLQSLYLAGDLLPYRYGAIQPFNNTFPYILKDIKTENNIVKNLDLKKHPYSINYNKERAERFILGNLFRLNSKLNLIIDDEILLRVINKYPRIYPQKEHFLGYQIFMENEDNEKKLQEKISNLEKRLKTEPFRNVAKDYYKSIGLDYDGNPGKQFRGKMPDTIFDIFINADRESRYFGPVKTERGYIFGKVIRKLMKDEDPLNCYGERVLAQYRISKSRELMKDFYKKKMDIYKPTVFSCDLSAKKPLDKTAYIINGIHVSFDEALKRFPNTFGDTNSPDFYNAVAKKSLHNDLIFLSPESKKIKKDKLYRFFLKANENAWLVNEYVKKEITKIDPDEKKIKEYYNLQKEDSYKQFPLVKLLQVTLRKKRLNSATPYQRYLQQKKEFNSIKRAREKYIKSPSDRTLHNLMNQIPNFTYRKHQEYKSVENVKREFIEEIIDKDSGYISNIIIDKSHYYFIKILSKKNMPPKEFDQVKVKNDYLKSKKMNLLKSLYNTDRVKDFL
jgi:hypothetical protein